MLFNGGDFFEVTSQLNEDQRLFQDTTRKFVSREFLPHIAKWFEEGSFCKDLAIKLGQLGVLGIQINGYGCPGGDTLAYGIAMMELERGDSALRSFASVQSSLVMYPIFTFGSEEQKKHWLPKLAQGKAIGCFGLTEPDFGSNPAAMLTTAKKSGGDWILKGTKTWITNAPIADVAVVWAQTDQGIRGFLVEKNTPGFHTTEIKQKLSLRASCTGTLYFDNCKIPESNMLPHTQGLKSALMCLNQARFGIAFGVIGAGEDCLNEALDYSRTRIIHNRPLASYQLTQRKLATMASQIANSYLVAFQLARLKENSTLVPAQVSMAKQHNVHAALEVARTAREILGANGISLEYRSMRHACNLESVYTYEGTNDIHLLVVGQRLTGFQAFS